MGRRKNVEDELAVPEDELIHHTGDPYRDGCQVVNDSSQ